MFLYPGEVSCLYLVEVQKIITEKYALASLKTNTFQFVHYYIFVMCYLKRPSIKAYVQFSTVRDKQNLICLQF